MHVMRAVCSWSYYISPFLKICVYGVTSGDLKQYRDFVDSLFIITHWFLYAGYDIGTGIHTVYR